VNTASAHFCSECGAPLKNSQLAQATQSKPQIGKILVFGIIGLLVIAALGLFIHSAATSTGLFAPAATATPTASPTPAGISPDQDLAALISNAADGDTLTLAPGTFTLPTGLSIEKSLTIVGLGAAQTTITSSTPNNEAAAMFYYKGNGKLAFKGVTLAYTGTAPAALIALKSGNLELEDCTLTGSTLSSSGKQLGAIQFSNDSTGLIRNSRIEGNPAGAPQDKPQNVPGGIILGGSVKLTVEDSEITDSYLGIFASDTANLTLNRTALRNTTVALYFSGNSSGTLQKNTLQDNLKSSLSLLDNAQVTATGNTITGTSDSLGLVLAGKSNLTFSENKISNVKAGINFGDEATGKITANEISGFSNVGINLTANAAPEISQNTIHLPSDSNGIGIVYADESAGSASNNILEDLYLGVSAADHAKPSLQGNQISKCENGMSFSGNSTASVDSNTIDANRIGVLISSPALPSLTNNTISGFMMAVQTDPENWQDQLVFKNNQVHDGPPVVTIATFTPTP
jgi:hypothetical protein